MFVPFGNSNSKVLCVTAAMIRKGPEYFGPRLPSQPTTSVAWVIARKHKVSNLDIMLNTVLVGLVSRLVFDMLADTAHRAPV